jgi:transcriptional regulator with GAF, ATPase, and Fis domain
VNIALPSLNDRKQDLPLLFNHFIEKFNEELNKNIIGLSKEAEKEMLNYNYPGNVRELSNIIESAIVLSNGEIIEVEDLPEKVKLKESNEKVFGRNVIKTKDIQLNNLFNSWIKQACMYGSTWCRWGWNGYRDIVQQGYGVVSLKPQRTREILVEALSYQNSNGLAIRGWNPIDEKAYSDSALWLVLL